VEWSCDQGPSADGIKSTLMKRMTAQQPPAAHPYPAPHAILLHRFQHVFRAGGMKAARRRQERRDKSLVETQRGDYCFPHCVTSRSSAWRSSAADAVQASRRGLITISHTGANSDKRTRKASRKRLFMRFRLGALPNFRGMVNPSLGPSPAPRGTSRQKAEKYALAIRFPWLYALRKSEVLRIRALFGKPRLVVVPYGSFVADREFMATLGAPPRQHGPPVLGAHPHPKSVSLCPFAIVWLKCPFWHVDS
jgi:hypothetical protein